MMINSSYVFYSIAGFCVSLLVGMTGVGGGALMTPLFDPSLRGSSVGRGRDRPALCSSNKDRRDLVHGFNRSIEWRLVGRLAAGSLPTTILTLFVLSRFGAHSGAAQAIITGVLGTALAATAAVLVFRNRILAFLGSVVGELDPWRATVLPYCWARSWAYWYRSLRSAPERSA